MTEALASTTGCGVCGRSLRYDADAVDRTCDLCGRRQSTNIWCPDGHFVCDACHEKAALEVLTQVLSAARSADPLALLEQVMAHPAVPMHGPEHHAIVPAVLVAAAANAGFPVGTDALARAIERGQKVPGGWCGYYGACGAALGVGIAVSVLAEATPLTGPQRSLALAATSEALARMLDDQPRCCKRASRTAIRAAVVFLRDHLGVQLETGAAAACAYPLRNKQCPNEECPYFAGDAGAGEA
jgi:hypothetical protein